MSKHKSFRSKLVGVTKTNDDGSSRQDIIDRYVSETSTLLLVREPDNTHDGNAIGVWVKSGGFIRKTRWHQIGYINADVSITLASYIKNGNEVWADVDKVTGSGRKQGVNITINKIPTKGEERKKNQSNQREIEEACGLV